MPVSLSASISQSQEPLRKKIFGNHGNILFWLLKSKQRTAIAVDNRKKKKICICFTEKFTYQVLPKTVIPDVQTPTYSQNYLFN